MIRRGFGICVAAAIAFILTIFTFVQIYGYNDALIHAETFRSSIYSALIGAPKPESDDDTSEHQDTEESETFSIIHDTSNRILESEIDLGHGVSRFDRKLAGSQPEILFLVLTKDNGSWGYNLDAPPRQFEDFLIMLHKTQLDPASISLALLTADEDEYELFKSRTASIGFGRTIIFFHPGYTEEVDREDRHNDEAQTQRRREIARLRNFLMFSTLEREPHTVWLDSDIQGMDDFIIQKMISHTSNPEVGIITARCEIGPLSDYDANAFGLLSNEDFDHLTEEQREINADPNRRNVTIRLDTLRQGTTNDDLVPLHSVGGTLLYMRSSLVKQGLGFTYQNIIGTTWEHEGWDGMETEGLCYRAIPLGAKCFALGGDWKIRHTDR